MDKVADFFLSQKIKNFFSQFPRESHHKVLKRLVKGCIDALLIQGNMIRTLEDLKKATEELRETKKEIIKIREKLEVFEEKLAFCQNKVAPFPAIKEKISFSPEVDNYHLASSIRTSTSSLSGIIYPNWWLQMCESLSPPQSPKRSTSVSTSPKVQKLSIPLKIPQSPASKPMNPSDSPKFLCNIAKLSPEKHENLQEKPSSPLSSYTPSSEMRDFYQEQFLNFLDSQRGFFQSLQS